MKTEDTTSNAPRSFSQRHLRVSILAWTALCIVLLFNEYRENHAFLERNSLAMARVAIEKDIAFRRWAAGHGGVYVPVTAETAPNPLLKLPERDIATPSGKKLTLMNPAYMTRQLFAQLNRSSRDAPRGHITSLKPIRAENAPDPWETTALTSFERGGAEFGGFESIGGLPYYRYMRPLKTEKACLACHAAQGYREGDLRGGISVAVPVAELERAAGRDDLQHTVVFVFIWLAGVGVIWVSFRKVNRFAASLAAERNNLTAMFDSAPVGMLLVDENYAVVRQNLAVQRLTGRPPLPAGASIGAVLGCVNHLSYANGCGNSEACGACRLMSAARRAIKEQASVYAGEHRIRIAANGVTETRWMLYSAQPLRLDGQRYALFSLDDITAQHLAQENIRKLSLVVEQSPACIVITDTAGMIEFVNPKFVQLTGFSYDEAIGQNPRVLKSDETPEEVYRELWETISAGNTWRGEFLNRKKSGELYWEQAIISPIRDADGAITHYMAIKEDITEQKSMREQLLQAQKMETIGRLTGCIAHDFNNILTPIVCYSEMLRNDLGAEGRGMDKVDRISQCAQRATTLVQQLLGLCRKQIVFPEHFDQNTVVRSFYDFLRTVVRESIDVRLQLSPEPCCIRADRTQLEQIIMNLVLNAQDAIENKGIIVVETSSVVLDEAYAKMHAGVVPGRYCLLSVSDTGCGMDLTTRERVFEPFFTTKQPGRGTGLGLAAVHSLTLQHGGHVRVYSEPGLGSAFKIYFPAVGGTPEQDAESLLRILPGPWADDRTILIVEDDDTVREMVQELLEGYGFNVLGAETPDHALTAAAGRSVDLVITDVVMPGMNGRELYERLAESHPGVKVLYMSGHTCGVIEHQGGLDKGVNFLQKPFSVYDLTKKVALVLDLQ